MVIRVPSLRDAVSQGISYGLQSLCSEAAKAFFLRTVANVIRISGSRKMPGTANGGAKALGKSMRKGIIVNNLVRATKTSLNLVRL